MLLVVGHYNHWIEKLKDQFVKRKRDDIDQVLPLYFDQVEISSENKVDLQVDSQVVRT
jgi:hypothetical protein